jgi:hypothetical protein
MTIRRFRWQLAACGTADEVHGRFLAAVKLPGEDSFSFFSRRVGRVQAGEMTWWRESHGRGGRRKGPITTARVVPGTNGIEIVGKVELGFDHLLPGIIGLALFGLFLLKGGEFYVIIPIGALILGQLWTFYDISAAEDFLLE